jgi:hypothetical protein
MAEWPESGGGVSEEEAQKAALIHSDGFAPGFAG